MESSGLNKEIIYDGLRKKWLVKTPEEIVRQKLLHTMVQKLSYPKELLSIEKSLSEMPHFLPPDLDAVPDRRADVVCFGKAIHPRHPLYPLIVIECKESRALLDEAVEQVVGYNYYLKAYFVAVAHPQGVEWGYFDKEREKYVFHSFLPSYEELIKAVCR